MDQHVGIGVSMQPARMRNLDPAYDQSPPFNQSVRVIPYSRSNHGGYYTRFAHGQQRFRNVDSAAEII
jgi:hypothetical protein